MEFNVQFDEYLPSTTASGLKVLIHDNGEVPFPEDGGIMAGTGYCHKKGHPPVCEVEEAYNDNKLDCIKTVHLNARSPVSQRPYQVPAGRPMIIGRHSSGNKANTRM
ncbi:hypothetical protein PoB_006707000 [Plakobranchus ocellatus]|uniref:Uncharacterized protein n=1 Tax=Plakobranchus ocellatus TaxID=259542 RepID=A0AAV4D925_9GAST|nr:hypothetical protein PoB_006707000 [Plakobranchus ocellatus]